MLVRKTVSNVIVNPDQKDQNMTNKSSKRDQLIALQADMRVEENTAMRALSVIMNSDAITSMIKDMEELKSQCLPGSIAESQLSACIDVPVNVTRWLASNYSDEVNELAPGQLAYPGMNDPETQ